MIFREVKQFTEALGNETSTIYLGWFKDTASNLHKLLLNRNATSKQQWVIFILVLLHSLPI